MLTNANGAGNSQQQQVSLDAQGQAHFWVIGTGAGATTVRVDLPYQLGAGTVFSHLDSGAPTQRLVLAERRSLTASAIGQPSVSASAPQPSPTGPTPAPQPSPIAATPPEQATPTQVALAATATLPPPTRRPSHRSPTPAPEQPPTETVISETQATAVPTPPADTSATLAAGGQAPPADQAATAAPASGAAQPRPSSLPNTGAPADSAGGLLVLGAGRLALGGWLIRRRLHS